MKTFIKQTALPGIAIFVLLSLNLAIKVEPEVVEVPVYFIYEEPFSEEALIEEIKRLNFRHPEIVLAQARLETGYFSSTIFKENNNLFGMKRAYSRPTTAEGTNNGHASYSHWKESLIDYALYSAAFLRHSKEEDVLEHLGNYYAQDIYYEQKVRNIKDTIKQEAYFHVP